MTVPGIILCIMFDLISSTWYTACMLVIYTACLWYILPACDIYSMLVIYLVVYCLLVIYLVVYIYCVLVVIQSVVSKRVIPVCTMVNVEQDIKVSVHSVHIVFCLNVSCSTVDKGKVLEQAKSWSQTCSQQVAIRVVLRLIFWRLFISHHRLDVVYLIICQSLRLNLLISINITS